MQRTVILHLRNEDDITGEVDKLPDPADQFMIIHNPRRRDGTKIPYLGDNVKTVLFPWQHIEFVQILPADEMGDVIGFVRE